MKKNSQLKTKKWITNDHYRNKKRIEDIKEIYSMYYNKIKDELDNVQKSQKPHYH